jgi:hypothetical protein
VPSLHQIGSHRATHITEPDECDFRHASPPSAELKLIQSVSKQN